MDSRAHVEAVCTIGCLLTPNSRKVMTVRSKVVTFRKVDFKFITAKSWVSHKWTWSILWEDQDFAVINLKSTFRKVFSQLLTVITLRLLGVRRHPIVQTASTWAVLSIYNIFEFIKSITKNFQPWKKKLSLFLTFLGWPEIWQRHVRLWKV